ncbi:DUF2157 domain-containing protein [Spirosoma rhododendri]|uniref:DUF2157 domain-containing protein n=1 Tax=Spirosoma rhododendri TaxID=2728024 RepID=A0A7L5DSK5_9BACT|nr:DUF2157 domain-containing protein [Spirosoma rhododendri]QJD81105.1 DUF2157 domain-containing protein [Spirosoma rhododendri]
MSPEDVLSELSKQGILSHEQQTILADYEQKKPVSVYWELRSMLYVGITALSAGLGYLIYDNFDQIGHGSLLLAMAAGCVACLVYAWLNRPVWSTGIVTERAAFTDYALLLFCLLFLTLEGYAQYQYTLFGTRYGLATLLPALLFLPLAYRFDHRGVLGIALTALISWVGVTVRPLNLYLKTNFFDQPTVLSAIGLSLLLIGAALTLERRSIKPHFTYTYLTIAGNLLLIAILGGLFNFREQRALYALALAVVCVAFDLYARHERRTHPDRAAGSFLFLLMATVYGYIGLTFLFFTYLHPTNWGEGWYYWYFILTGIALIAYLIRQLTGIRTTA